MVGAVNVKVRWSEMNETHAIDLQVMFVRGLRCVCCARRMK